MKKPVQCEYLQFRFEHERSLLVSFAKLDAMLLRPPLAMTLQHLIQTKKKKKIVWRRKRTNDRKRNKQSTFGDWEKKKTVIRCFWKKMNEKKVIMIWFGLERDYSDCPIQPLVLLRIRTLSWSIHLQLPQSSHSTLESSFHTPMSMSLFPTKNEFSNKEKFKWNWTKSEMFVYLF